MGGSDVRVVIVLHKGYFFIGQSEHPTAFRLFMVLRKDHRKRYPKNHVIFIVGLIV